MPARELTDTEITWDGSERTTPDKNRWDTKTPQASLADHNEVGRFMVALSEGPIRGLVDNLKSVYLDGSPTKGSDGTVNQSGFTLANLLGYTDQGTIEGFSAAESETSVNVKVVKATPQSRTYTTTGINRLRIRVAFPALRNIVSGVEYATSVTFKIERQSASHNGGAWQEVTLPDGGVVGGVFSGKSSKSYTIDLPAAGPWSIRITRISDDAPAPSGSNALYNELWWEATTTITDSRFRYPGVALLAASVDAKNFQSIPSLTADVYGFSECMIPANYDPIARTYATSGTGTSGGAWDGTFVTGWTNNPAWILLTVATNTRWGLGERIDASKIKVFDLYRAAQHCDELVNDGKGGTEPRFTCSTVLQEQMDGIKLIQTLASVMNAVAYGTGNEISIIQDRDDPPAAIFSASNVIDGRFTYEGTAASARHTAAIVSYIDPDNGYKPSQEYVEDQAAIARYGYLPLEVTAEGCTSRGQARRKGLHALISEQTQTETVSFATGLEGAVCTPGIIIQIQDWSRAGQIRAAGRIAGVASNVITLDAPVTLGAGKTYTLKCTLQDGTVASKAVSTGASTTATITLASAFSPLPIVDAQWQLVEASDVPSLYRVVKVSEEEAGSKYSITALLHNPAKYAAIEAGVTLGPVTPRPGSKFPAVSGLTLNDRCEVLPDRLRYVLDATWTQSSTATGYAAEIRLDSGVWEPMTMAGASASFELPKVGACDVRVQAVYNAGTSAWATASRTVSASSSTPSALGSAADVANAATLARQSGNLVKNPGTDNTTPPSGSPEAAGIAQYNSPGVGPLFSASGWGRHISLPGGGSQYLQITTDIPVTPGEQYYFECLAGFSTGSGNVSMIALTFDAYGAQTNFSSNFVPPGQVFTNPAKISRSFTVPAGNNRLQIVLAVESASSGTEAWFNRFYLERRSQAAIDALSAANDAQTAANNAQASANAANATLANISSDDVLSAGEKGAVIQDYNVLTSEQAGIDAQATAYSVSRTAYDNAISALTSYLGGLSPAWNNTSVDTPITGSTFRTKFADCYTTRQAVLNAIYAAAKALADAAQTTGNQINSVDYLANVDKITIRQQWDSESYTQAQLNTQASAAGVSSTAYGNAIAALSSALVSAGAPANWGTIWPDGTASGPWAGIATTIRNAWGLIAQERAKLVNAIAKAGSDAASSDAAYADMLARSSYNLIKNGNSESTPKAGSPEASRRANLGAGSARNGNWLRVIANYSGSDRTGYGEWVQWTQAIPCAPGDQFFFEVWARKYNGTAGTSVLNASWLDSAGNGLGNTITHLALTTGYQSHSQECIAPAGACGVVFYSGDYATPNNQELWFDDAYACRKISAGMLEADIALLGVVRSPGYSAGSSGNAPTGFKLSGPAFTTTYKDGTTDANCHFELEGAANFGGYKVATVNSSLFTRSAYYSAPGTHSWVCPPGVNYVRATLQGGGGAGGGGHTATYTGGGGGGGSAVVMDIPVVPGNTYTITVGAGGSGGVVSGNGGDGGESYIDGINGETGGSLILQRGRGGGGGKGGSASAHGNGGDGGLIGAYVTIAGGLGATVNGATPGAGVTSAYQTTALSAGTGAGGGKNGNGGNTPENGGGSWVGGGASGCGGASPSAAGGNYIVSVTAYPEAGSRGSGGCGGGVNQTGAAGGAGFVSLRW